MTKPFYCCECWREFDSLDGLYKPDEQGRVFHDFDEEGSAACGPVLPREGYPIADKSTHQCQGGPAFHADCWACISLID